MVVTWYDLYGPYQDISFTSGSYLQPVSLSCKEKLSLSPLHSELSPVTSHSDLPRRKETFLAFDTAVVLSPS